MVGMRGSRTAASLTILTLFWYAIAAYSPHHSIPYPHEVAEALVGLAVGGELLPALTYSVARVALGYASAAGIGVLMGAAGLYSRLFRELTYPIISFVIVTPAFAFVPLLMLVVGLNEWLVFWAVVICVSFPITYALYGAIKSVDPSLIDAAKVCGAGRSDIIFRVILPLAVTHVFALLKVEAGHAWRMVFVTEFLALTSGLGGLMIKAYALMKVDEVLALVIVLGALALATQKGLEALEDRLIRWRAPAAV